MRIVLAHRAFAAFAGTETYTLTLADQLVLLGHEVTVHALELGPIAEHARERGLTVVGPAGLPESCDAVLVQDPELAATLAARYPGAARIFVVHSTEYAAQAPPQLPGVVGVWVVLNDRVRSHLEAAAHPAPIERLRQPVDVLRFARSGPPRSRPERVLVFGHDHGGEQLARIRRVCDALGLEVAVVGRSGTVSPSPEHEIAEADIVIGLGRCAIEAMAARRAAYVSGVVGTDGWVTPRSYPALEADGFSGRATEHTLDETRLRSDLEAWTPELGEQGKDLAFARHDAARHAAELVGLWRELGAGPAPSATAAAELARLGRIASQAENRALGFAAEAANQRAKAEALRRELDALQATARWRAGSAIARPLDLIRAWVSPPRRD